MKAIFGDLAFNGNAMATHNRLEQFRNCLETFASIVRKTLHTLQAVYNATTNPFVLQALFNFKRQRLDRVNDKDSLN